MVKIYVDADACPVKNEVERVATRHNLETYLVCDGGIRPPLNPLIQLVVVNHGTDAADDWIADHIGRADICVTNDIPLAILAKQHQVIRQGFGDFIIDLEPDSIEAFIRPNY